MMSEKKKKKAGKVTDILRAFICGLAIWGIFFSGLLGSLDDPLAEPEPAKVDTRTQAEKIADQFSTHDGRHYQVARQVRTMLHDPDSFKHLKTAYAVVGDKLQIFMSYYATNGFGAQVLTTHTAMVDIETEDILSISRYTRGR
jgi:hypothetical protein